MKLQPKGSIEVGQPRLADRGNDARQERDLNRTATARINSRIDRFFLVDCNWSLIVSKVREIGLLAAGERGR